MPTRLVFAEHEPTSKAWRGVGALDLYDSFTGQRAGPTVHKKTESNKVLILLVLVAGGVRDESLAGFICFPFLITRPDFECFRDVEVRLENSRSVKPVLDSLCGRHLPAAC